jgi:hypothetical protein
MSLEISKGRGADWIRSFVLCETRASDGNVAVEPFEFQGYFRQMELG